jgi:hypothetical protein
MRCTSLCLIIALAMALGCAAPGGDDEEIASTAAGDDIVTQAAGIAREIAADPDSAEAILARHGMTIEQFDQMMFDISADPELSEAYAAALGE